MSTASVTEEYDLSTDPDFACVDCDVNTAYEYYMVENHIWHEAGMKDDGGMLCVACLEIRLGRILRPEDFTEVPVNQKWFAPKSDRLLSRLFGIVS